MSLVAHQGGDRRPHKSQQPAAQNTVTRDQKWQGIPAAGYPPFRPKLRTEESCSENASNFLE
jgi:hypothetical protein